MQIYLFRVYLHFFGMVKIMRCPKCGKECNEVNSISSNIYICPFCADNLNRNGNDREDFNQVFKQLVESYGVVLLEDINRTNALLMDYVPHSDKERKLMVMVMREGVVSQLMKMVNEDENNQRIKLNRCIKQLVDSIWITEAAAKYAVMVLATAIGMHTDVGLSEQMLSMNEDIEKETSSANNCLRILTKDAGISSEDAISYALKESDSIGYKALAANTNIQYLTIPDHVTTIYPKAFLNCVKLSKIILPKNIKCIGICAFEGCSSLEKIEIIDGSTYKVIDGVLIDKVNKRALRVENNKNKETVRIVNGVSTICKKTFDRSPVKCIGIPISVNCIEENAFYLTRSLERFEVDAKNSSYSVLDGVLHNKTASILVKYPQGKKDICYYLEDTVEEIGTQAFSCAQNIHTVTFTGFLKRIGSKAFEYCTNIENLLLPGNVEIIGDRAFQYCESMRGIMLSKCIQEIGDCAFYNCISLETISIPKNVKKIGNLAFAYCKQLKTITVQENIIFVGDGAFVGCENVEIRIKNNSYMETYCRTRGIKYSII